MQFRLLRAATVFTLLCSFTFISPLQTAFAENTEYSKISLDKWERENCKVVITNDTTKNTPFYLEHKNQPDSISWAIGSYRKKIGDYDPILIDGEDKDFISPPIETNICIRIPGKIAAVTSPAESPDYSLNSLKSIIYAGVYQIGKKANFNGIDSTKFQVNWMVTEVTTPEGILQKDIEIGKIPVSSGTTSGTSKLKYQPLVANTLLVKDMLVDSEEGIHLSFQSSGIYTLKIQTDISYRGVIENHFTNIYNLIVGDEVTLKNRTLKIDDNTENTTGRNSSEKTDISTSNIEINTDNNPNNTPQKNHTNNPKTQPQNPPTQAPNLKTIPPKKPYKQHQHKPQNNSKLEDQDSIFKSSDNSPTIRADRTAAQEAGMDFLKTAPLLIVGTVVLVGATAAVTIFLKI